MGTKLNTIADAFAALERLEIGALDAREARVLLREALAVSRNADMAHVIYASLRSWTGRMLRSSAASDDLREWYNLFLAIGSQFRGELGEWAIRIDVLSQLVSERVGMAETRTSTLVLSRKHVSAMLGELAASDKGCLGRTELLERLGLEQANLTRVATLLLDAGMIVRREEGRNVSFELTSLGRTHARVEDAPSLNAPALCIVDKNEWSVVRMDLKRSHHKDAKRPIQSWAKYDDPLPVMDYTEEYAAAA